MSDRTAAFRLLAFTVASALAAASCGGSEASIAPTTPAVEASDYPMYKGGVGRTGEAVGSGPSGPAVAVWSVDTTGRIESGPAIVDGVLYIVAGDRTVRALDSSTGEARWTSPAKDYAGSPAVAGGRVYVVGRDFSVAALSATDGHELWRQPGTFDKDASPLPLDDIVVGGGTTGLTAFDAATGTVRWTYATAGSIAHAPSAAGGAIYVGSEDGVLHAVDAATGAMIWTQDTHSTHFATTAVRDGVVYAMASSDDAAKLLAVDVDDGATIWTFDPPPGTFLRSPSVDDDTVYVSAVDGGLYALSTKDGAVTWEFDEAVVGAAPVGIAGGTVYVLAKDLKVYAVDPASGSTLWSTPLGGQVEIGTTIASGRIYGGTTGGDIVAIGSAAP